MEPRVLEPPRRFVEPHGATWKVATHLGFATGEIEDESDSCMACKWA